MTTEDNQGPLSLTEAIDALMGGAATNSPEPQTEVPPAKLEGQEESSIEPKQEEAKQADAKDESSTEPTLADDEQAEEAPDPGEGFVTIDGPIEYEDTSALVVKDKDGKEVNVSDLLGERYMQDTYTQDMRELTGIRKELETSAKLTDDFQNVALNEVAGLVTHYNQYWNQLPNEARQILKQLAGLHDSAREQQQVWRSQYQEQLTKSRIQEVRHGTKRLRGYVPNWNRGVYEKMKEHYQTQFGTDPRLFDELIDPGLMAGLYQGMQNATAKKTLRRKIQSDSEPTSTAAKTGGQRPPNAPKKMPDTFGSVEEALEYITQ